MTGACPVTTDVIARVSVGTTTTTIAHPHHRPRTQYENERKRGKVNTNGYTDYDTDHPESGYVPL